MLRQRQQHAYYALQTPTRPVVLQLWKTACAMWATPAPTAATALLAGLVCKIGCHVLLFRLLLLLFR